MKKIYLTFDIEPLVNKKSFNPTVYNSILAGGVFIAKELEKRNLKGTFYISLSRKTSALDQQIFEDGLDILLRTLTQFDNILVQPHLHAYGLPMSFSTENDLFGEYSLDQQIEMLDWARRKLENYGYKVESFRPGTYSRNMQYYEALKSSGYIYSSLLNTDDNSINIDCINKTIKETVPEMINEIIEFPVTSVKLKSIKGKVETINLSPDFLTMESMDGYFQKLNYININFHSFSVFTNKFLRENHKNVWLHNFKYFFWNKPMHTFLRIQKIEAIEHDTVLKKEFLKWIDYIQSQNYNTYFIGEQ